MQGNRTNHPPRIGMRYWTKRRQQELEHWEQRQAVLKVQRAAEAKEQRRLRANASARAYRARRKAAGLPTPKRSNRKPEKKGNSTIRMRRWREKWRILLVAWGEAIREDRRRTRRIAKGLPPIPKKNAEMVAASRAKKAAVREEYLRSQWFSPELSEQEAKAIIMERAPAGTDEMQVHLEYVRLSYQAKSASLNLNRFTIAQEGEDGIEMAKMARAIFNETRISMSTVDYNAVLNKIAAEKITELRPIVAYGDPTNETWLKNLEIKSIDSAQWMIGNGSGILQAVQESHKTKEKK